MLVYTFRGVEKLAWATDKWFWVISNVFKTVIRSTTKELKIKPFKV